MAVTRVSFTKVFWKLFGLLVSNTSKRVPLLDLKQVADFTKFERSYVSFRSEKWLSYLFTVWLKLLDTSSKNKVLFSFRGRYAHKEHHFFLEIVSSIPTVSENLVSRFSNLLAIIPCFTQINFPPHFDFRSLRKGGDCKFSKINCEFGKLSSSLVSSTQNTSKGAFAIISLRFMILFWRVLICRYPMIGLLGCEFLTLIKPSISSLILASL